jgi:hypothetical protein
VKYFYVWPDTEKSRGRGDHGTRGDCHALWLFLHVDFISPPAYNKDQMGGGADADREKTKNLDLASA